MSGLMNKNANFIHIKYMILYEIYPILWAVIN